MNARPWAYVFHTSVPKRNVLDPFDASVTYDSGTDTLFSDLWPSRGPAISCLVGRSEYVRIEMISRRPVGTQIDDFTRSAVSQNQRFLELATFAKDLFNPSQIAHEMLSVELKFKVIYSAVVSATRAYDHHHGIRSLNTRRTNWIERELRPNADSNKVVSELPPHGSQPTPPEEFVLAEFVSALDRITLHPQKEQGSDFDRMLQYWYGQPAGSTKRATGQVLLDFVRSNQLDRFLARGIYERPEEFLLKALKAS